MRAAEVARKGACRSLAMERIISQFQKVARTSKREIQNRKNNKKWRRGRYKERQWEGRELSTWGARNVILAEQRGCYRLMNPTICWSSRQTILHYSSSQILLIPAIFPDIYDSKLLQLEYSICRPEETKTRFLHIIFLRNQVHVPNALRLVLANQLDTSRLRPVHVSIRNQSPKTSDARKTDHKSCALFRLVRNQRQHGFTHATQKIKIGVQQQFQTCYIYSCDT